MNGWLLVRIAGIVVGIASLLRLATTQGLVTYDPLFQEWMDRLRDLVELGFLTDVIQLALDRALHFAKDLGWHLPDLSDEWRNLFVLNVLLLGALARHIPEGFLGILLRHDAEIFLLAWAPICAITGAIIAGLYPGLGFVIGLTSALVLFYALGFVLNLRRDWKDTLRLKPSPTVWVVIAMVFATIVSVVMRQPNSTYLSIVVATVALLAIDNLINGIREGWWSRGYGFGRARFGDPKFNVGLDILGVMLGALGIASLFATPSLW